MSRFPPVQRYLGWLQRFLYQVETGNVPPVMPVVQINQDWPIQPTYVRFLYNTIAGTQTQIVYTAPEGKHALVFLAEGGQAAGGALPAGETVGMDLSRNLTPFARVFLMRNLQPIDWAFIGSTVVNGNLAAAAVIRGADPVYVGTGNTLRVTHTSAAGGVQMFVQAAYVELPMFMPLRLP